MTLGAPRWSGPLSIVAFAACLMLGILVSMGLTAGPDIYVSQALSPLHGTPLGALLEAWERVGDLGVWLVVTLVIGLVMASAGRRLSALWFLLAISADALASLLKLIFALPRPPGGELLGILGQTSFAYPSGHVTRTLVLLGLLGWAVGQSDPGRRGATTRTVLALGVAVGTALMGVARVASGEHWASDVIGGALLGLAWLAGVVWIDGRIRVASAQRASTPSAPRPGP
jgi:undecaprenyl-diphosphatase